MKVNEIVGRYQITINDKLSFYVNDICDDESVICTFVYTCLHIHQDEI